MHIAHPLPFAFPYALIYWALYLLFFIPEFLLVRRTKTEKPGAQDRGSTRLIFVGNPIAATVAVLVAFFLPGATITGHRLAVFWLGIVLLTAGGLLRWHCFHVMGNHFKPIVDVKPGQTVVNRGAYRFIRHPSYTGGALMFIGVGLALTNIASLLVLVVMLVLVYGYRIKVEEAALLETLGDEYRDYSRRTKRLVPFVW